MNIRINVLIGFALLIVISFFSIAVAEPCTSGTVPPLTLSVRDSERDFLIPQPAFLENFDISLREFASIPNALDIRSVDIRDVGEFYQFYIKTNATGLANLTEEKLYPLQIGVYIDKDRNGESDLILTTTDNPRMGFVLTSDLMVIDEMPIRYYRQGISFSISKKEIGDNFDWIVFTGYSPRKDAYFRTPIESVSFMPIVDVVYPNGYRMIDFITSLSGTGQSCQVTDSGYHSCPSSGPIETVPGSSYTGVMIYRKKCGDRSFTLWCLGSFFAKQVTEGTNQGWIARCPYTFGFNTETPWDLDGDGIFDRIIHQVEDRDAGGSGNHDGDNDMYLDVMNHDYLYATNKVTSCNLEFEYPSMTLANKKCCPARPPYTNPSSPPGNIEADPQTGQMICPP